MVLLAALLATGSTYLSAGVYLARKVQATACQENLADRAIDRAGESALKEFARAVQASSLVKDNPTWDISIRAEGRTVSYTYRFKGPVDPEFKNSMGEFRKPFIKGYCANAIQKAAKGTETHTFYNPQGEWLTSFSIGPDDCP